MNLFRSQRYFSLGAPIIAILAVIVIFAHGYNMFGYPYYENDEGIYMAQAYSLLSEGKLSPYTYWYDHAPAGWFTLAAWAKITGGFFTFGSSVDSGRALMFLFHLASAALIFFIAGRLSKGYLAPSLAVLIFSLSPLAIYYQRRVLLDNMMIFWVLLALALLVHHRVRLWHVALSALSFGIAILTKESAIFFTPAFLYLLWLHRDNIKQRLSIPLASLITAAIVGIYPLYAYLRGELFESEGGISLIGTLKWQMSRGSDLWFWQQGSEFALAFKDWMFRDPYLTIGGIVVTIIAVLWSVRNRVIRIPALFLLLGWLFLLRGGLIFNFYIIALIPFFALATGMIAAEIVRKITQKNSKFYYPAVIIIFLTVLMPSVLYSFSHYTFKETPTQMAAVEWVKENLPAETKLIIDDYAFVDYRALRFEGDKAFINADVFSKVEFDPTIRSKQYDDNWQNIKYIVASNTFDERVASGDLKFVGEAYETSRILKQWQAGPDDWAYKTSVRVVDLTMPVTINYLKSDEVTERLKKSWQTYKKFFLRDYGQIIDPSNGVTTSEGQSYAMLRAVWMNDKPTFDGSWQWTRDHFQFRNNDKLLSWKWSGDKLQDSNNATDGDEDIALALLFAYKKWGDETYLASAKEIIADIWKYTVVDVQGRYYLLSAHKDSTTQWNGYLFNPSYLSPATYRIFAEVDKANDWNKLADDTYDILNQMGQMPGNKTYLPSDWMIVQSQSGAFSSADDYFDYDVDRFSFDAFRTFWRVALDYQWFGTPAAKQYLDKVNLFLIKHYQQTGSLPRQIMPDGTVVGPKPVLAINAGYLAALMTSRNSEVAKKFFHEQIDATYNQSGNYWGDKYNYYDANWAWFGTAMYNGNLINLWK